MGARTHQRKVAINANLKLSKVAVACEDAGGDYEKAACLCNSVNDKGLELDEIVVECANARMAGFKMGTGMWSCAVHKKLGGTVCKPMCPFRGSPGCAIPPAAKVPAVKDDLKDGEIKDELKDEQIKDDLKDEQIPADEVIVEERAIPSAAKVPAVTDDLKDGEIKDDLKDEQIPADEVIVEERAIPSAAKVPAVKHDLKKEEIKDVIVEQRTITKKSHSNNKLEKEQDDMLEEEDDKLEEVLVDEETEDDRADGDGPVDGYGGNTEGADALVPFDSIPEEAEKCMTIPTDADATNRQKAACVCDIANGAGLSSSDLSNRCTKGTFRSMMKVAPPWACALVRQGATSHCTPLFPWRGVKKNNEAEQPAVDIIVEERVGRGRDNERNDLDDLLEEDDDLLEEETEAPTNTTGASASTTVEAPPTTASRVSTKPAATEAGMALSKRCIGAKPKKGTGEGDLWRCQTGRCIPNENRCNGWINCIDGSDEVDCPAVSPTPSMLPKSMSKKCSKPIFPGGEKLKAGTGDDKTWRCTPGWCVSKNLRCNGIENCDDGSDEVGC